MKAWSKTPFAIRHSLFAEHALLSVRILDPACGSGHFLLAAARRLGKELARIRTGEEEPAPEQVREAIRDVVAHCIYGVDKNPLAVELCKVALWLEAHTPGKPLTFLDHRIKCGDSLVGVFDLEVLKRGIPDEAFKPVSGDDKETAKKLKAINRNERRDLERGQLTFAFDATTEIQTLNAKAQALDEIADDSPEAIRKKKNLYDAIRHSPFAIRLATACDLWTAAFFQPKNGNTPGAALITTNTLRRFLESDTAHPQAVAHARTLAQQHRFFHWPVEFPEVFVASSEQGAASGGQGAASSMHRSLLAAGRSPHLAASTWCWGIRRSWEVTGSLSFSDRHIGDIWQALTFLQLAFRLICAPTSTDGPLTCCGRVAIWEWWPLTRSARVIPDREGWL